MEIRRRYGAISKTDLHFLRAFDVLLLLLLTVRIG